MDDKYRSLIKIFSVSFCLMLAACTLPSQVASGVDAVVRIVSPADGATLVADQPVDVISVVGIQSGATSAVLMVNDSAYRQDEFITPFRQGNLYLPWIPPGPGTYTLMVILITSGGSESSESITVYVGETVVVTDTPWITSTATLTAPLESTFTTTPTATVTNTVVPQKVEATSLENLFCRSGPGKDYATVDSLTAGQTVPILGISQDNSYIVVEGPVNKRPCWVWAQQVTITGSTESVDIVTPPPLPTRTPTATATETKKPSITPTPTETLIGPTTP
jgi:uncharacterized protein YraI